MSRYQVIRETGSGHRAEYTDDYRITEGGHLSYANVQGQRRLFSAGGSWTVKEVPADD